MSPLPNYSNFADRLHANIQGYPPPSKNFGKKAEVTT